MTICLAPTRPERLDDAPLEAVLANLPDTLVGLQPLPGLLPIASPMHRATAREQLRLAGSDGQPTVVVKRIAPELRGWINSARSIAAQQRAAALGVAPDVLAADPGQHVHMERWMDTPWRSATLTDLSMPAVLDAVLAAKRRLHTSGPLVCAAAQPGAREPAAIDLAEPGPWHRTAALAAALRACGIGVPPDLPWLLRQAEAAAAAIAACPVTPTLCQGDGSAGNVLISPNLAVQLVDYDLAGNADPWWDLASTLVEACEFDEDWAVALERFDGRVDGGRLARLRLYGMGDDLMWGLWGCLQASVSPRRGIEFFKYGQWRLLRCRQAATSWAFESWLRTVGA